MKKEKKKKEIGKFRKWHQKMKSTPKGRAYLKLIYWAIFFAVLFIFLAISSVITKDYEPVKEDNSVNEPVENEPEEDVKVPQTIEAMQQEILNHTYRYTYDITVGSDTYLFEGIKYYTYEEGYKTYQTSLGNETVRYYVDHTGVYQFNGNEKVLVTDLYQGVDMQYLDFAHLFDIMNILVLTKDTTENRDYSVYYAEDGINRYTLSVSVDGTYLTGASVTALDGSYDYQFSFSDLGDFDE